MFWYFTCATQRWFENKVTNTTVIHFVLLETRIHPNRSNNIVYLMLNYTLPTTVAVKFVLHCLIMVWMVWITTLILPFSLSEYFIFLAQPQSFTFITCILQIIEVKENHWYKTDTIPSHHEVNHSIKEASRRHPYQMHYIQLLIGGKYSNQGKESSDAWWYFYSEMDLSKD